MVGYPLRIPAFFQVAKVRGHLLLFQAIIQVLDDGFTVHILADEHQFLHAVAHLLVPLAEGRGVRDFQLLQFVAANQLPA